jgi:hypothetical protein
MALMGYSGARGTLIYEKNLKAKISCQTPFKINVEKSRILSWIRIRDPLGKGTDPGIRIRTKMSRNPNTAFWKVFFLHLLLQIDVRQSVFCIFQYSFVPFRIRSKT